MDGESGDRLSKAYCEGEALGAFSSLAAAERLPVRTLVGLVIGQRVSFRRAKAARAALFLWLDNNLQTLFPDRILFKLLRSWVGEELELALMCGDTSFTALGNSAFPWANEKVLSIVGLWRAEGVQAALKRPGVGIGPWTRKAFGLLCRQEQHILHEDAWISKRWRELQTSHSSSLFVGLKSLKELERRWPANCGIDRRRLSFLLWRINSVGTRRLAAGLPLNPASFI